MSAERPVNVTDMIAWLRAHPREPFFSLWSKDRLLIGTRNDTGEIVAWDCNVQASKMEYDRRASPAPETRTAAAPETRTGEGAGCRSDGTDVGKATCDCPEHVRSQSPREGTP